MLAVGGNCMYEDEQFSFAILRFGCSWVRSGRSGCTLRLSFGCFVSTKRTIRLHFAQKGSPSYAKSDSPFRVFLGTMRTIRLHFAHEGSPSKRKVSPILRFRWFLTTKQAIRLDFAHEGNLPTPSAVRFSVCWGQGWATAMTN